MKKIFLLSFLSLHIVHADYIWKHGKLIDFERQPWLSVQEHYNTVLQASDQRNWLELIENGVVILNHYENSPFIDETRFLVAKAFLELNDFSRAHDALGQYLNYSSAPKHYEEVMSMKLDLAHAFANGKIRNLVGLPGIPHWIDPKKEALELFEEVSSALPTHYLAEQAVMGKADLEIKLKEYRLAINTSESFLRKYSKSSLAPQAFENIGYCQLKLVEEEFLDPDLLSLAEMNYKKFSDMYPSHPKLALIEKNLLTMKEMFAKNLYTSALWYQKVKKTSAADFYFQKIQDLYPGTEASSLAKAQKEKLAKK